MGRCCLPNNPHRLVRRSQRNSRRTFGDAALGHRHGGMVNHVTRVSAGLADEFGLTRPMVRVDAHKRQLQANDTRAEPR